MANVIKKATNKFLKGLVMDFSPENTRNEVLTHALNATLLTFNGNEMSLQNDMGNARVETAYLPEGYIPVGTCEFGGIIYIVSYNPLEDKSQIGCFPSPERNVSIDEMGLTLKTTLSNSDFQVENGKIKNNTKYVLLRNDKLNPGDKFIIYANEELYEEKLVNLETKLLSNYKKEENPILALNIVSIEDSGQITYLDSSIKMYEATRTIKDGWINRISNYKYHILGRSNVDQSLSNQDLDEYRNVLSSGYNVFKSKTSGKLAILAELIMVDSYSVTHKIEEVKDEKGQTIPDKYNVVLYQEVSCDETNTKYGVTPKLSYYYLEESDGILQLRNTENEEHVFFDEKTEKWYKSLVNSPSFYETKLKNIIGYEISNLEGKTLQYMYNTYYKNDNVDVLPFDFSKPNTYHSKLIYENNSDLNSILLGTVVLPDKILDQELGQSLQLPFTYKYKIIPCMSYGKLENLAVANTIDFNNINNFNASKFNIWKYRVDGPTVHLQFGAEIYDTSLEDDSKVNALVLEFYDLWGFAGSILIDNKKAYSGVFTKILTLNSIDQLSNNKVPYISKIGGTEIGNYTTTYQRHKNIVQTWDTLDDKPITKYYLNDSEIKLVNQDQGWRQYNTTNNTWDLDIENDCGTLYSNLIYGVKAYFVQDDPNSDQKIFTFKDQFFMFTTPLFNNYYYTVNNFNTLNNPELDFVLTSRIKDSSNKESLVYDNGSLVIENGYKSGSKVEEYIKGSSAETTIQDTKYYKYKGTSELQLEIGLKKDYNDIGLMYDRNINKYFECTLELVNNDNIGTWSVESDLGITDQNTLLNYKETDLKNDDNLNSLGFNGNQSITIPINTFQDYHFLDPNDQSGQSIPISYEFVVGYDITINNIRQTQIPTTTVCALCHKRDDGTYNYEDFGIEEGIDSSGNPIYFSQTIFYNSGTNTDVHFGLCRQLSTTGNALTQCSKIDSSNHDAVKIQTPRILNVGDPLKDMLPYIGKLSFCEPHLSGFSESDGVNISPNSGSLYINPDLSTYTNKPSDHNSTFGIVPSNELYKNPQYLLCANTKNMISRQSEFVINMKREPKANISDIYVGYNNNGTPQTLDKSVNALKFIGLTGQQLTDYNKKLLETMKGVYAYNPDYNSLSVRVGDVSISDNKVKFTSNIICKKATIDFASDSTSLNDFVSIGNMSFSNYFSNLSLHSNIITKVNNQWLDQINFVPNIDYCGGKTNKTLLQTITYNTPDISDLYDELTFSNANIIIRHENGDISYINGDLNPKMLYGFKEDTNQLIQLDVSNYNIENDGRINLGSQVISINTQMSDSQLYWDDPTSLDIQIGDTTLQLTHNIQLKNGVEECDSEENGMYTIVQNGAQIQPQLNINNTNPQCKVSVDNIELDIDCYCLNETYTDCNSTEHYTAQFLSENGYDDIYKLLTGASTAEYACIEGLHNSDHNVSIYRGHNGTNTKLTESIVTLQKNDVLQIDADNIGEPANIILLVHFTLKSIDLHIEYTNEMQQPSDESSIVNINPTINYFNFNKNTYSINDSYASTTIRGTNITLNDLVYEPNIDGHRLYMRPNCFKYFGDPRARLYYRTLTPDANSNISTTWKGDTDYYNMLFINTGPCFIPDNLS